jgi:hypothetical protein
MIYRALNYVSRELQNVSSVSSGRVPSLAQHLKAYKTYSSFVPLAMRRDVGSTKHRRTADGLNRSIRWKVRSQAGS